MTSLVSLKRRIKTAKNISQLTRALEMVSASKMRKAKDKTLMSRPYADKLFSITSSLSGRIDKENTHPLLVERGEGSILWIIFAPDRALCGAIISNLLRELYSIISSEKTKTKKNTIKAVTIGRKMSQKIVKTDVGVVADFPFGTSLPSFDFVLQLRSLLMGGFLKGDFSQVYCLYTKFDSVFIQKPATRKILPLEFELNNQIIEKTNLPYLFEPNPNDILESLLPHYLEIVLYQILMESYTSEQAARMNAMHNATENAKEIVDFLTLEYNKIRQEKITNEILDIVTATIGIEA